MDAASVSGALKAREKVLPLSLNTNLRAELVSPWMVKSPAIVVSAALIVPRVSMTVEPPMSDDPFTVPVVMIGLLSVLLLMVCTFMSVVTTPEVGKVALPLTPVPPTFCFKIPVTAFD